MPNDYQPSGRGATPLDPLRCRAAVRDNFAAWQCFRTAVVPPEAPAYCRQHDPAAEAARRARSAGRWETEMAAGREREARRRERERLADWAETAALPLLRDELVPWLARCVRDGGFRLPTDVERVYAALRQLVAQADQEAS